MTADSPDRALAQDSARAVLRIPARTVYLAAVRELVAAVARELEFPQTEITRAVMAVDEACVNIIEHAYPPHEPPDCCPIEVDIEGDATRLLVTITDRARVAFSPVDHPTPDLASYWTAGRRKGLGLLIVRTFMDDVSHAYRPGRGNELRLVKYASRQPSPASL